LSGSFWGRGQRDGATRLVRQLRRGTFLRVIVASRTPSDRLLPLEYWVTQMLCVVLPISGGATRVDGVGYWINRHGRLIREQVAILDTYLGSLLGSAAAAALVRQLTDVGIRMHQETLAIAVDHHLHLLQLAAPIVPIENGSRRRTLLHAARNWHAHTGSAVTPDSHPLGE
jgi:hypothetical protein